MTEEGFERGCNWQERSAEVVGKWRAVVLVFLVTKDCLKLMQGRTKPEEMRDPAPGEDDEVSTRYQRLS